MTTSQRESTRTGEHGAGYAVVDVETTGLHPYAGDRVIQVAIRQVTPAGELESAWETLVNPGPGIDPGPVHVHGLTREQLDTAPTYAAVAGLVAARLAGRTLVAHNAAFDWAFIAAESDRARTRLQVRHWLCTMALAKHLGLPLADKSLATLAAYYEIEQLRAHDAGDDTRVAAEILARELADAASLRRELPLVSCNTRRQRLGRALRRLRARLQGHG